MSELIHKSHNISALLYHILVLVVVLQNYTKLLINDSLDKTIQQTSKQIPKSYEIKSIERETQRDYVHLLIHWILTLESIKNTNNDKGNSVSENI